ncbi:MAG TPA: MFS transporter [Miltoncostaeaceae bacterium]|nr:MFS transporter [Miltoncostaeaceae bacterium]
MSAARPSSPRLTLAGLVTAAMAFALMQTFLIPALPKLQEDLGTSGTWVTWTVTAYLLTGSVATPLIGRLGDQHGKARLMVISLAVFLVGSVAAIFAWNVGSLIVFRAIQGVGGAVFPLSFAIIRDEFPPQHQGRAMGLVSAVLGVGGGVGIVASGLIVDNLSWRWLFVVAAVVVAAALVLVWRFVPESSVRAPATVDMRGALLLSGALVALLVGLTEGQDLGWASPAIVGLFAASATLFVIWGLVELRVDEPMVDMRMLARRTVLFTNITAMLSGFALYMTWVILPAFYQLPGDLPDALKGVADYGFGTSVTVAGLWMLPTSLSILVAGPVAGALGDRYGGRAPLVAGMILVAIGSAGIAMFHAEPWQPALWFILCGVGIGFAFAVMPKLIVDAVKPTETGIATGMNTVVRTVGGVVGAQVGAVLLAASSVAGTGGVPAESGFVQAFWVGAAGAVVAAFAAVFVGPRRARSEAAPAASVLAADRG